MRPNLAVIVLILLGANVVFLLFNMRGPAPRTAGPAPSASFVPPRSGLARISLSAAVFGLALLTDERPFGLTDSQRTALVPLLKKLGACEEAAQKTQQALLSALDERQKKSLQKESFMEFSRAMGDPVKNAEQLIRILRKSGASSLLFPLCAAAQEKPSSFTPQVPPPGKGAASASPEKGPPKQMPSPPPPTGTAMPATPNPNFTVIEPPPTGAKGAGPEVPVFPSPSAAPRLDVSPPSRPTPLAPGTPGKLEEHIELLPLDYVVSVLHARARSDGSFIDAEQAKRLLPVLTAALAILREREQLCAALDGVFTVTQKDALRARGPDEQVAELTTRGLPPTVSALLPVVVAKLEGGSR